MRRALLLTLLAVLLGGARSARADDGPLRRWSVQLAAGVDVATAARPIKPFDAVFFGVPQRPSTNQVVIGVAVDANLSPRSFVRVQFDHQREVDERMEPPINPLSHAHRLRSEFRTRRLDFLLGLNQRIRRVDLQYSVGVGVELVRGRGSAHDKDGRTVVLQRTATATNIVMSLGWAAFAPAIGRLQFGGGVRSHLLWNGRFTRLVPSVDARWNFGR